MHLDMSYAGFYFVIGPPSFVNSLLRSAYSVHLIGGTRREVLDVPVLA